MNGYDSDGPDVEHSLPNGAPNGTSEMPDLSELPPLPALVSSSDEGSDFEPEPSEEAPAPQAAETGPYVLAVPVRIWHLRAFSRCLRSGQVM